MYSLISIEELKIFSRSLDIEKPKTKESPFHTSETSHNNIWDGTISFLQIDLQHPIYQMADILII